MAWVKFEGIEFNEKCVGRSGKPFSAYVVTGTKMGSEDFGTKDEPFKKYFFENSAVTVIEKGIERPGMSAVQFFQKACNPGDTIIFKNVRRNGKWDLVSIENRAMTNSASDYEPLSDDELLAMRNRMPVMNVPSDPTRPATPQMGRVQHMMAS